MKHLSFLVLAVILLFNQCTEPEKRQRSPRLSDNPLMALEVMQNSYPRAFFFRASEKAYKPYQAWESNFKRLSGIIGKVLHEEVRERDLAFNYFKRFKADNPQQLVLLHFNGNARDPEYRRDAFFAGHWLYYNGCTVQSSIDANKDSTRIHLADAGLFKLKTGTKLTLADDIAICALDEKGKPNWNICEQVKLLDIDYHANTITVRRACYGTEALAFEGGKAYAAAHVTEGPFGKHTDKQGNTLDNNLLWYYNFSTHCPKDPKGRQCWEVLAKALGQRFCPGGDLNFFDGIEFDVLHHNLKNHSYAYLEKDRFPDCDTDGKADWGFIDGLNTYGIGSFYFCKSLRKIIGDEKFILADGFTENHIRAFPYLNGIESEGFPFGNDVQLKDWSGGLNRHLFWNQNAKKPAFSFINHRWWEAVDVNQNINLQRMIMAAAVMTNTVYCASGCHPQTPDNHKKTNPEEDFFNAAGKQFPIFDEIIKGKERQKAWLGKARNSMQHLAEQSPNIWRSLSHQEKQHKITSRAQISIKDNHLNINNETADKTTNLTISNIPCKGADLTIVIEAKGEALKAYPQGIARLLTVSIDSSQVDLKKGNNRYMSWINDKNFKSVFYFPNITSPQVDITIAFEGNEPITINNLAIYQAADICYREFENGIVLVNPSFAPYSFDINSLFPQQNYRRLQGRDFQYPGYNNGEAVSKSLTLNARDAIFLIKDKKNAQ